MLFLPRRWRIACFFIVTPWQIGVILTANYTFLNYLVLVLAVLLLDDRFVRSILPVQWRDRLTTAPDSSETPAAELSGRSEKLRRHWKIVQLSANAVMLSWIAYATTAELIWMFTKAPLPSFPVTALEPFRIANQYGLFAVMTRGRYEIEFQGSDDDANWVAYPFRYKPQALNQAPGIYAPYQPRFEWNLWFASLGDWRQNDLVPATEMRLLANEPDVLELFRSNPFPRSPPRFTRAVLWQYWFTSSEEKRRTGDWWRRQLLGLYAPELTLSSDGKPAVIRWPDELPPHD
jgi:hypothetical protein